MRNGAEMLPNMDISSSQSRSGQSRNKTLVLVIAPTHLPSPQLKPI